jgi:TetR/AcrR family transcriptional regulator, transcriptional repressor of aconitase
VPLPRNPISVLREAATGPHRSSPGAALAHVLDEIRAKHIDNGFAAITVMVWSEALRNPALAAQLTALRDEMGAYYGGLATDIRLPTGVPGESFATVLGSISAGFILQLALFGPDAAEDLPATARALWPAAKARSVRSPGNHALKEAGPLKE